jgi:prepilin-type N-terminal cleavage/methylation domain-containing protein
MMPPPANPRNTALRAGFTLIEMAVVLVIIGLIVGAVLVGQTLIKAATVRSQIKQVQDLETQISTFRTKYNCIPGDCANATQFFGTTDANGYTVTNGEGDGIVRATTGAGAPFAATDCLSGNESSEITQLFLQLNNAGMGNYPSDGVTNGMNKGFPEVALHNGTAAYVTCLNAPTIDTTLSSGNVIVLGAWQGGGNGHIDRLLYSVYWGTAPYGIPIDIAHSIDQKIDDGLPNSGAFGVILSLNGCLTSSTAYTGTTGCGVGVGKWIGSGE